MQLVGLVLLHSLVSVAAIERHEPVHARHVHHNQKVHSTVQQAMHDHAGKAVVRREEGHIEHGSHGPAPHHPHRMHQKQSHQRIEPSALVGLHDSPTGNVDAEYSGAAADEAPTPAMGADTQDIKNEAEAEAEVVKVTEVVQDAEEKAGLPDSTKTTPEPYSEEPSNEDQESNALMIALISLVVLAGTASAGWSIWMARGIYAKRAAANATAGEGLLEGEGEGEAAGEGEATEAAGEGETAAAS